MMFMLAGYLIEKVDGRPWEEAVPARIFGPLGMDFQQFLRARLAEVRRLRPPV